jgi:hypothetical protein
VESATAGCRPSNPENHEAWDKKQHKNGEAFMVKKTISTLAFALIAPFLAFAQTSTTTTEQKATTQRATTTETGSGTVLLRMSQAK